VKIVLDAMGGDKGLGTIVDGALLAARELGVHIVLVGRQPEIESELKKRATADVQVSIVHASQVIEMDDEPGAAVYAKRDSSMVVGMQLVKRGEASAFVSAGNSGGVLAAAQLFLGRTEGVRRAALGTVYPTLHGRCFVLDVGATTDCKPEYLYQFGIMGSAYAHGVLHVDRPRVGIISTGEEEGKGSLLVKEAAALLKAGDLNFVGNIEGKDIPDHPADVVVTDGFTGNVFIKTSEGVATLLLKTLEREIKQRPHAMLGALLARSALRATKASLDYSDYGGAALLGVNGIAIVAHGRSNAKAIKSAVRVAKNAVDSDIIRTIREGVV
jgi:phosphate acyltransferase